MHNGSRSVLCYRIVFGVGAVRVVRRVRYAWWSTAFIHRAKTGGPWRLLPASFGSWKTVYGYFHRWRQQGDWKRILDTLTKQNRTEQGRRPTPSAGLSDAQSVKTATQGKTIGYDAGKKVKGRKRPLLVDTEGRLIECVVTAASTSDADGLKALLSTYFSPTVQRLKKLWVDGGYRGEALKAWVAGLLHPDFRRDKRPTRRRRRP